MNRAANSGAIDRKGADERFIRLALTLAARGLGTTAPNPSVGAVIVRGEGDNAEIVGRGWTGVGGRPHAETAAIARAGEKARGATLYVTLEPCNHHGKTPPCSEAIIAAGISRVVATHADPDLRVSGSGFARLRAAGIEVVTGILERPARWINAGHTLRMLHRRPFVQLKLAVSRNDLVPYGTGRTPVWVTGSDARAHAHLLRAQADAIMVGIGTVLADDPLLTCRLPGLDQRSPIRVVLDRRLEIPIGAKLVATARVHPLWIFCSTSASPEKAATLEKAGVSIFPVDDDTPGGALAVLADNGVTRLLVEGGVRLAGSMEEAGLIDEFVLFRGGEPLARAQGKPLSEILSSELLALAAFAPVRHFGADTVRQAHLRLDIDEHVPLLRKLA